MTNIGDDAFSGCDNIRSVVIPRGCVVSNCFPSSYKTITSISFADGVTDVCANAFAGCSAITTLSLPSSIEHIGENAFSGCTALEELVLEGDAPACDDGAYNGSPANMKIVVNPTSAGWVQWNGRSLEYKNIKESTEPVVESVVSLVTTNVVIHYIVNSVQPQMAIPTTYDTGFVNIITEVKSGGAVSVPVTWMVSYPSYTEKFGTDFTKSLTKYTGKTDGAGNPMLVWQDYVAGTDPTDLDDKFTASITMADGVSMISYSPELSAEQAALRSYKTYGKAKLVDEDWTDVTNLSNAERANYNFFKVSVEMK